MAKFQLKSGNAPTFMEMGSSSPLTQKPGYLESLWGGIKNIGKNVKGAFSDPGQSAGDKRASADREQELREFRDKNPDQFAICKIKDSSMEFKRLAPNFYDISLKIEEVW